jgi:hypothetical protein
MERAAELLHKFRSVAAGIQTNHPVELMAFLRANGYHK